MKRTLVIEIEGDDEALRSNGIPVDPNQWDWLTITRVLALRLAVVRKVRKPHERGWR